MFIKKEELILTYIDKSTFNIKVYLYVKDSLSVSVSLFFFIRML